MATLSIPQVTSTVKTDNLIHIDFLNDETPVVLSADVARHFQLRHSHILRDIDRLRSILPKSFNEPNFGLVDYTDSKGEKRRAFLLSRDAFSLLVMGMTGKAAIQWKLRYIEAFNALEAAVLENRSELARESGYQQGLDAGKAAALPVVKDAEEKARQETARMFWALGPAQKRRMRAAARYRDMGLTQREISRLMDISRRSVQTLLKAAEVIGELPCRSDRRPVQGSLLEVRA